MKLVRQLVKRQSAQEGLKNVGDEYPVSAARAAILVDRNYVEIVGDVTVAEARALTTEPAPVTKVRAKK